MASPREDNNPPSPPNDDADLPPSSSTPPFQPIFTLLTDATTNTTIHPRVRYLFSDDDPSPIHDPSSRAIIVDLAPADEPNNSKPWSVKWASSTSPDFAVTRTDLSAQQGDDATGQGGNGSSAMMLRVEGVTREQPVPETELRSSGSGAAEGVDGLAEEFRRRVGVMRGVVESSERRRAEIQLQQKAHEELELQHEQEQQRQEQSEEAQPPQQLHHSEQYELEHTG